MSKLAGEHFDSLQRRIIRLDKTRGKLEVLFDEGRILKTEVEQLYSGLYLDAFVSLERYIEELFVGYLCKQITPPTRDVKPKLSFQNSVLAREVILSGKRYLDWLPYKFTKERAEIFFCGGHPFCTLTKTQENLLEELHRIRNALAHRSDHSYDVFLRLVVGSVPLQPRERKPAAFLRSALRVTPIQTRCENYFAEMLIIAKKLSEV